MRLVRNVLLATSFKGGSALDVLEGARAAKMLRLVMCAPRATTRLGESARDAFRIVRAVAGTHRTVHPAK